MSDVAITTAAEPDGAPRIAVLDILRGVAILAILFMNINDMGQSLYASFDDVRHLGWSTSDRVAWWLREVLANGTARCLLEMLFGAGMVILTDRIADTVGELVILRRYYARNLILYGFGLVHIFVLLWPGDILHTYGLAALVAFLFRRLHARALIMLGLSLAMFTLLTSGYFDYYQPLQTRAQVARIETKVAAGGAVTPAERALVLQQAQDTKRRAEREAKSARIIAAEDAARRGTARSWAGAQWKSFLDLEGSGLEVMLVWEAASVMLLGAGLFRLGVLQGHRSRRFYFGMLVVGYAIGVPLRIIGGFPQIVDHPGPNLGVAVFEVARQAMTLGHVAAINLLVATPLGARLLRPFVAAGRTALSIYVAQTLICLWVLYPPFALGLYGTMTWGPLMLTAFGINAMLLIGANLWVRRFDMAPVEWAWRSLLERRLLPWRRHGPARPIGGRSGARRSPDAPLPGWKGPR